MAKTQEKVVGYLPDETPTTGKLIVFAFQQLLVMFPATVTVALLTGFHVSTTIFASGLATIAFLLITKGKIPLYYGSSFSYIAAIVSITGASFGQVAPDALISQAQFGIIMSGLVSIGAGLIVSRFGMEVIEKVLPASVTGSIAMVIGISLAGTAITGAAGWSNGAASDSAWIAGLVTLFSTIIFSVYLKGVLGQLPILFGILVGYLVAIPLGLVNFGAIWSGTVISIPHFTLPAASWMAVAAIMPIAIATIPESTAHLFQLDIYVNDLAKRKGKKEYRIADKLGINLSFFQPLANAINSVPSCVINGACVYLFGVIGAQGVAIMINKKVDLFDARPLSYAAPSAAREAEPPGPRSANGPSLF